MSRHLALDFLTISLKVIATLVIIATLLTAPAVFGSTSTAPGSVGWIVWALRIGGAAIIAYGGLVAALLLYALSDVVAVLLAIKDDLSRVSEGPGGHPDRE